MKKWDIKLKDVEAFAFRSQPKRIQKNALWEVPHLVDIPGAVELKTSESRALLTYGLMIPKNSANRRVSYRVIETLLDHAMQKPLLDAWPLATTLRDENNELGLDKRKRAAEIRRPKTERISYSREPQPTRISGTSVKV